MPFSGTLTAAPPAHTAAMPGVATPPLVLDDVDVLHAHFEVSRDDALALLPPALTTTIPASVYVTAWRVPAGPLGAFTLAQLRLGCRSGVRGRGLLLGAFIDNARAGHELEARWGLRCAAGDVSLVSGPETALLTVSVDGSACLALAVERLEPVSSAELAWPSSLHPGVVADRADEGYALVQFDPEYEFASAARGRPVASAFDAGAWGAGGIAPAFPIAASVAHVRAHLPAIRFVLRPA